MSPFAARRVFLFGIQIAGAMGAHTLVELRPPTKSNASGFKPDRASPCSPVVRFLLIVLGIVMVALAALRFLSTAKSIDSPEIQPRTGSRVDITLAVLLVLLGCALFFYLSQTIVSNMPGR